MSVTHVWTKDGVYLGQIYPQPGWKLGVEIADDQQREKVTQALTSLHQSGSDWIELRAGTEWRREIEFPSPLWVAVASIMVLPSMGYRVRVLVDAEKQGPSAE